VPLPRDEHSIKLHTRTLFMGYEGAQAKNGLSRLAGVEGPRYEDNEATLDDLKARITKTLANIKAAEFVITSSS
jgi:hypothetical protein